MYTDHSMAVVPFPAHHHVDNAVAQVSRCSTETRISLLFEATRLAPEVFPLGLDITRMKPVLIFYIPFIPVRHSLSLHLFTNSFSKMGCLVLGGANTLNRVLLNVGYRAKNMTQLKLNLDVLTYT
jgi:hypothetical protein